MLHKYRDHNFHPKMKEEHAALEMYISYISRISCMSVLNKNKDKCTALDIFIKHSTLIVIACLFIILKVYASVCFIQYTASYLQKKSKMNSHKLIEKFGI